jgi:hypothetical protein
MIKRGSVRLWFEADTLHEFRPAAASASTNEQIRDVPAIQTHYISPQLRLNGHCDVQQMQCLMQVSS